MTAPIALLVPSYGPVGNPYAEHVAGWWDAVLRMDPAPAEVIVAHSDPEPLGLLAAAPSGIRTRGVVVRDGLRVEHYMNAAIGAASVPWVSCIGVDDRFFPSALADIEAADAAGADVLVWRHDDYSGPQRNRWDTNALRTTNTVHGSCPFRVSLWKRVGGYPLVGWSDWAFWLRAVAADAKVMHTDTVGVLWDPGRGQNTWTSQAVNDAAVMQRRNAEIAALVQELFP